MKAKQFIAEFIGTFALIFVGVGSIASDYSTGGDVGLVGIALAHGLTIAVMATAVFAISGGHFNPAVTIGVLSVGKMSVSNALNYIAAQLLGGIAGAFAIGAVVPRDVVNAIGTGTPRLAEGIGMSKGMLTEFLLTFFLVFVIFGTAVDRRAPRMGALYIGLTVTMAALMGGPWTGAALNPARYLGPALVSGLLSDWWIYLLATVAGGVAASQLYMRVLADETSAS